MISAALETLVLETVDLTKAYGGIVAVNKVNLTLRPGEAHGVIGPNGAGKSSLLNLLTGQVAPSSGRILLHGRDIGGMKAHKVARLGIGRSFQKTNIYPSLSCWDNVWLAAQATLPHAFRFFRPARSLKAVAARVADALARTHLTARTATIAGAMSYGEQRQLEIAMVLATGPEILALDEPMAGMGHEESAKVTELLLDLRKTYPLLLVEHDMDAVFAIAHTLTVMVNGRVIASGPTATVRGSQEVQDAYLGDGAEAY